MITNIAMPINYNTVCSIVDVDKYFQDIFNRCGIIVPRELNNKNKFNSYDYISSMENNTNIENEIIYKKFDILSSEYNDIVLHLNFPISFKIEIDENGFYYINEKYNLYVYGKTQNDAENNILEAFMDQVYAYCNEDDINLDENAQLLKQELLKVYKYAKKKE